MKKLILLSLVVMSFNASAFFPSLSDADFDATVRKARSSAEAKAVNIAQQRGEKLASLTEVNSRGLTAIYEAVTESGCQFDVNVGLFFRAKATNFAYCQ